MSYLPEIEKPDAQLVFRISKCANLRCPDFEVQLRVLT